MVQGEIVPDGRSQELCACERHVTNRPLAQQVLPALRGWQQQRDRGTGEFDVMRTCRFDELRGIVHGLRQRFLRIYVSASLQRSHGDRHMGLVRRQIDDDFGIALAQKTLEVGVVRARAKALLSCSGPLFNAVTDGDQGGLVVQTVELWEIDPLRLPHRNPPHRYAPCAWPRISSGSVIAARQSHRPRLSASTRVLGTYSPGSPGRHTS